jgi:hypothetical protein
MANTILTPTGTSADAANIQAALTAMAGVGEVRLKPGTFVVNTSITIPSNVIINQHPNAILTSTVDAGLPDWAACPFVQVATFNAVSTTTNGAFDPDTATDPHKITLTSVTGISVNDTLVLVDASHHVFYGLVVAKVGSVVTFDRPIPRKYPSGSTVLGVATQPTGIRWYGNGGQITGTGIQAMEFAGAKNCHIEGLRIAGSFTGEVAVFDTGSRDCSFRDMDIDATGTTVGLSFESGEHNIFYSCRVKGATGQGLWIADGIDCGAIDCVSQKNTGDGIVISDQTPNADHYGSRKCFVRGGNYSFNAGCGVSLKSSSTECIVDGVTASRNASRGIQVLGSAEAVSDSKAWLAPARNKIANCTAAYNVDSGVYLDSADTQLANVHAYHNGAAGFSLGASSSGTIGGAIQANNNTTDGVNIVAGSTKNAFSDITASNNGQIGINAYGDVDIVGLSAFENVSGAFRKDTSAVVSVDGARVGMANGTGVYMFDIYGTLKTTLRRITYAIGNAQGVMFAQQSTGELYLDDISGSGGSIGAAGVAAGSIIRLGPNVDLSSCSLPLYDTAASPFYAQPKPGLVSVATANANVTLTFTQYKHGTIEVTGANTAKRDIIIPRIQGMVWTFRVKTTGGFGVRIIGASGTGQDIADTTSGRVYHDGTNVVAV